MYLAIIDLQELTPHAVCMPLCHLLLSSLLLLLSPPSGYWCDTIDPRTGTALHSTPGTPYDEVIGASVLLGYDQVTPMGQAFTLISHPDAATQVCFVEGGAVAQTQLASLSCTY
jgi:hypothetical protein